MNAADSPLTVMLPAELTIPGARQLKTQLLHALRSAADQQPIALNPAAVERIDTAGLQIMCAFFKQAHAHGVSVVWTAPCTSITQSAQLAGLQGALALVP